MLITKNLQKHPYHLVDPSPWPFIASLGCLILTFGITLYFNKYNAGLFLLFLGFFIILYIFYVWWRDVVRESTYEGQHTLKVQKGLRYGMILFITSEVMFFFAFFWAFFHSALAPTFDIGSIWPPLQIQTVSPWGIPLLNTIILLTSGATVTWAHHGIIARKKQEVIISLICTIILAFFFTGVQLYEYKHLSFSINDSVFGSTFFLATGFHGLHVLIGTFFLIVCGFRIFLNHFTQQHHFGFEAAAWYWHFVDVVWLFLFIVIYWWGGK